ncbi:CHAT domain-containing protein [Pedobacter sp. SD-b]|uniref:CHAT domain-containing protein n=1 Tax=Pedobacter segetis TaxID=2793069 RepID=A0ABS1BG37_9SPHI|nr:CHAT domain-containing protein [Pedobacter segetis]MBK0381756.1 CHAT domain-containing protein [Pedobacter segetis]
MKKILSLLFVIAALNGYAQNEVLLKSKLNSFKADDNLAAWIDYRIDYATEKPAERLDLLLSTEKKAWRKAESSEEKEALLYLYINQGYYSLYNGDILGSIDCYEKAYDYQQKNKLVADVEEYILKPLSNNYTRLGDYGRAIYIQNKSLALAILNKNKSLAASIYSNLSTSYKSQNQIEKAEKAVIKGLAFADKKQPNYGLLLSNYADIKNEQQKYDAAFKLISQSISFLKSQKNNELTDYWLLSAYTLAGNIQFNRDNYSSAQSFYNAAIKLIDDKFKEGRNREKAQIFNQLGKIKMKQKQFKTALNYFDQSLKLMVPSFAPKGLKELPLETNLYAENRIEEALLGKADALENLKLYKASLDADLMAFEVSEKLRKEFTYSGSKETLQKEGKKLAEKIIDKCYALYQETKDQQFANKILLMSEMSKARLLMDDIRDNERRIAATGKNNLYQQKIKVSQSINYYQKQYQEKADPKLSKKISDLNFQLSAIQKQLNVKGFDEKIAIHQLLNKIDKDKKVLIFFFGEQTIYSLIAEKGKVLTITKTENATKIKAEINDFMKGYFFNGPSKMINNPQLFYQRSNQIFEDLFSKINLKNIGNLVIVKDGVLNYLPFESLITDQKYNPNIASWPYLINKLAISYGFSLQTLVQQNQKGLKPFNNFTGIFLSNTGSGKTEINAVKKEYHQVKNLVKGKFLLNDAANLKDFKQSLNNSNVLHISSHAYVKDNETPVLELYKSKFYLFELANQGHLPSLVVLSACQTSDGELVAGEGVMSMTRGFIAAGTKGVISGLWNVNDESASKLMKLFYENLLKTQNPQTSLRNAKLTWIYNQKNKIYALPYYWDSLIFAGQNPNIKLAKNNHFFKDNFILLLIGGVIIVLVSFLSSLKFR